MPPETTLPNSPDARTPDGTLKDQGVLTPTNADSSSTPQNPPTDGQTPEPAPKQPTDGKSIATDDGTTPAGAPEKYADFKAPEGVTLDKTAIEAALPIFKELNLNQDQAQKLIDHYVKTTQAAAEGPVKAYTEMQKEWRDEGATRFGKDIEPGGKIVTEFASAINGLLPPTLAKNFKAALDFTGVGNHPDFIEGFRMFAKLFAEGTHVQGKNPSPGGQQEPGKAPKSIAQAMYPNLPSASGQ